MTKETQTTFMGVEFRIQKKNYQSDCARKNIFKKLTTGRKKIV